MPSSFSLPGFRALACALAASLGTGCATLDHEWDMPLGKPYQPENHVASGPIPAGVQRVGVLPLHSDRWTAEDMASLETAVASELAKCARFEVVQVTREALAVRFGAPSFLSSAALPADFLSRLQADFALDAVLLTDLTHYSPYQPISIGMRAKLVSSADARPLWAFDSVFDAAQPSVAVAARRYHAENSRPTYPLQNTAGILQSPARYAKYVAHAMWSTLPPREAPSKDVKSTQVAATAVD